MKKTALLLISVILCLSIMTSCSDKTPEGQSGFSSPTALSGLLCAYFDSLNTHLLMPSEDAAAESDIELSYSTEDGVQTEHRQINAAYSKEKKAFSVGVDGHSVLVAGDVSFDGAALRDITSKAVLRLTSELFVRAFTDTAQPDDFTTAPDSIRAAEDDVEVSRITLKLDKERYGKALDRALSYIESDKTVMQNLTDIADLYCYLHNKNQSGEELLSEIKAELLKTKENEDGVVWQRYVRGDKTAAERIKTGESLFRYITAEAETYTELDLEVRLGGKTVTAAYEMRKTGMSDSYNIRIAAGNEITYFDGKAESAFKSGTAEFKLRATQDEKVINAFEMTLKYNGVNDLTYNGSGTRTVNGDRKSFDFDLVFRQTDAAALPGAPTGSVGITEAAKSFLKN